MTTHTPFFAWIEKYIAENPEAAAHVADHVQAGLTLALEESRSRAADMEIALAVTLAGRHGASIRPIALDKLRKWRNKSALEWGWAIDEQGQKP